MKNGSTVLYLCDVLGCLAVNKIDVVFPSLPQSEG